MDRLLRSFFFLVFTCCTICCNAQKKISARYSGGHGCIDNSLTLYTDSTYLFESTSALLFVHTSTTRGKYLLSDSSIILYKKKKLSDKYRSTTFRIRNNDILMYSEKEEFSKDSSFVKAYNTMWRRGTQE
jgi:hypothetical protein